MFLLRGDKIALILSSYMSFYDFKGLSLDEALRKFTSTFHLTGESQALERIIEAFVERFVLDNPTTYPTKGE